MNKIIHILCVVVLLLITESCIKETLPECPVEYIVKIQIKDKNYFNIAQFPQLLPQDENMPFIRYSGTINYSLTDINTGKIVRQIDRAIPGNNDLDYTLSFSDVPEGEYELLVWGNLKEGILPGILHDGGNEDSDLYTAGTKINITPGSHSSVLQLERTKGKLLIICKNFPSNITRINQKIAPVYKSTDAYLNYSEGEVTQVEKEANLIEANELVVAPTPLGVKSKLNLSFYSNASPGVADLVLPETEITIHRNELSAVTVDFNQLDGAWEVWVFIEGEWTMVHHLVID